MLINKFLITLIAIDFTIAFFNETQSPIHTQLLNPFLSILNQNITFVLQDAHGHLMLMLPHALHQDWREMKPNLTYALSQELVNSFRPTAYEIIIQTMSISVSDNKLQNLEKRELEHGSRNDIDHIAYRLSETWKIHVDEQLPTYLKTQIQSLHHHKHSNHLSR